MEGDQPARPEANQQGRGQIQEAARDGWWWVAVTSQGSRSAKWLHGVILVDQASDADGLCLLGPKPGPRSSMAFLNERCRDRRVQRLQHVPQNL